MADQADLLEALRSLSISSAPPEWANEVWEQNFCEGISLPRGLELGCVLNEGNWARLVSASRRWLEDQRQIGADEDGEDKITILLKAQWKHTLIYSVRTSLWKHCLNYP